MTSKMAAVAVGSRFERGFVEDEDARAGGQHRGDGDALFFAAGERGEGAVVADAARRPRPVPKSMRSRISSRGSSRFSRPKAISSCTVRVQNCASGFCWTRPTISATS